MWRFWLEKKWVQNLILGCVLLGAVCYWGFFFEFGYNFDWSVIFTKSSTYDEYLGLYLISGLIVTLKITLFSAGLALFLGTFFGLGRLSRFKPLYWVSTAYVEFFRNTPLLVQLFFWYFAMPQALPENIKSVVFGLNFEFWSATVGLGIYTGSFMAEVIRAGLQSIPKGLLEASYSGGLSYLQVMRTIILPLAFRAIIPPLGSEFLNNMKNSSLAMVVGVADLTWQSQQIESLTFRGFEATTAATVIYLSLSLIIAWVMNIINSRLRSTAHREPSRWRSWAAAPLRILLWPGKKSAAWLVPLLTEIPEEGLQLSPAKAAWIRLRKLSLQALILLCKMFFILGFLFVLLKLLQGLWGFNWQVIGANISRLLVWRFPTAEGEFLWGLGGLSFSILMSVMAIGASFFIGLVVGLGRMSKNNLLRLPCMAYIEFIRGNPLIIVIFWVYFFIPVFFDTFINVFWSATIALTVFTGAYIAEIVRGGIMNIPAGHFEAAYSTGLTYYQTMRRIVLPQALKQMIPAIVGQFIAIFKDTSLAFVIGVMELTFVAQMLNNRLMVYPFEIYGTVAFLYFICCYAMSILAARLEQRLSKGGRVNLRM